MSHWFENLLSSRRSGAPGAILRFNTSDRVFSTDATKAKSITFFLAAEFHTLGAAVCCFSLARNLERLTPPGEEPVAHDIDCLGRGMKNPSESLGKLTELLRKRGENPLVLIVDYAEHLVPDNGNSGDPGGSNNQLEMLELVHSWSLDDEIRRAGNFAILLERGAAVHSMLVRQGRFDAITIPLPDQAARQAYADVILSLNSDEMRAELASGLDVARLAQFSSGLRLTDVETLFRHGSAHDRPVTPEMVTERKKETIRELCAGLLEVVEPNPRGFDAVAGNYNAKAYFRKLKPLWKTQSPSLPMGVLLAGVPGTGKSFLIRALAHEFELPCVAMRSVREMWVGQSERNLERVLATLDSLAPCLLWSDEVDQTVGQDRETQGGGDSGTSSRMLARFLEFTGDSSRRGKILWVGTTNRPDLLDPATLSRFEVRIPFLHPRGRELTELWPELLRQLDRTFDGSLDTMDTSDARFDMMSARSLMELISLAGLLADSDAGKSPSVIRDEHMRRALAEVQPEYDDGNIRRIALTALYITRWQSLLPWEAMGTPEAAENGWPRYLDEFVDAQSGRLHRQILSRELGHGL